MKKNGLKKFVLVLFLMLSTCVLSFAQDTVPYRLFKEGKYKEAITAGKGLIELDPTGNISSYAVLGWSYLNLKQWNNALQISKDGLKFNANDARLIQIMAESYYSLNEDELALKNFARYLKINPNGQLRSWSYYYIGSIYERQGKLNKAHIAYSAAVNLEKKSDWMLSLANVLEQQKLDELAIVMYQEILLVDKNNGQAKQKLLLLSN